jgi:hypothetical protein
MLPGLGYYCGMSTKADVQRRSKAAGEVATPDEIKKLKGGAKVAAKVRREMVKGNEDREDAGAMTPEVLAGPLVTYEQFKKTLGRPPTYRKDTHPAQIFELMAPPYSFTKEVAAMRLGIHRNTLYEWIDKYDEFGDAVRAGLAISEEYQAGRLGSGSVKYAQGLIFYMKNRHAWKDKSEIEHTRKVDDLVKDADTGANRVGWSDIVPSSAHAHTDVIDAEVLDDTPEDERV